MSFSDTRKPVVDHQRRFQSAVDVIQNLPKNGSYRPSYQVMLRFYSLYKQAVFGPCTVSRPGFWDLVGRYKWDAWMSLGAMSREQAMEAYVDEMKKVAQEVIDTVPMDETTASFFHLFEPLYEVIDDMPRPPASLFTRKKDRAESAALASNGDSEKEVSCDSIETVNDDKSPGIQLNNFQDGGMYRKPSPGQGTLSAPRAESRQVGAGAAGQDVEGGTCLDVPRRPPESLRAGGAARGNVTRAPFGCGRGRSGRTELHLQQQIVAALQRLGGDMKNAMERLEVVERLAGAHDSESRANVLRRASDFQKEESWGPSGPGQLLFFLLWPIVAQALVHLIRRACRRRCRSS